MKKFTTHKGIAVPIDRPNVDTDALIPKQFLKSIERTGFGVNLFDEWRYLDMGEPNMDATKRPKNEDFVLNFPRYKNATVLVARENFGCGSSREHAVWALDDYGIRAILAPSYSDIFFSNCFKNGVLPIRLTIDEIDQLITLINKNEGLMIEVDLEDQRVSSFSEEQSLHTPFHFEIDAFQKHCLINGLDDIGLTLQHANEIRLYEAKRKTEAPWLFS